MAESSSWSRVLDDADEATAQLIVQLQLEDVEALGSADDEDSEVASRAYEVELRQYRAVSQHEGEETVLAEAFAAAAGEDETAQTPPPPADTGTQEPMLFQCASCHGRFDADHSQQVPCEHYYCDDCLTHLFASCTTDETLYPPRCCRQTIPYEDVKPYIPADVRSQFEGKKEELDDRHRVYCRVKTCSTYIGYAHREGDTGTCPQCANTTCLHCSNAPHEGDCERDEATQQLNELAAQEGWRKCGTCGRMVELTIGCNHMTCICHAEFCYVCGAAWRTCECPQWEEHRLTAAGANVVDRQPGPAREPAVRQNLIAAAAQALRENHECEHGNWQRVNGRLQCEVCHHELREFIWRCRQCQLQACWRCRNIRL